MAADQAADLASELVGQVSLCQRLRQARHGSICQECRTGGQHLGISRNSPLNMGRVILLATVIPLVQPFFLFFFFFGQVPTAWRRPASNTWRHFPFACHTPRSCEPERGSHIEIKQIQLESSIHLPASLFRLEVSEA